MFYIWPLYMSIYIYNLRVYVVLVSSYPKIIYKRLIVISFWPKGIQTKFLILAFINCKILLLWRLNQSIHLYVPNSLISFLHSTYMAWIYFISLVFKASFEGIYCFVTKHPQISSLNLTLLVYLSHFCGLTELSSMALAWSFSPSSYLKTLCCMLRWFSELEKPFVGWELNHLPFITFQVTISSQWQYNSLRSNSKGVELLSASY